MNLNKFGRWSGIVVAVAMLAMVLQGCGGDDNGADQDMRDQLAMLQGDLDAANAAKMEAETAKTMAEEAQAMAETAKMAAEMERDEANVARGVAEAAKMVADQAATDAMAAQEAAEAAQATAEMAQAAAEMAKTTAETDRDSYKMMAEEANTAKMVADQAAADAMTAKMEAEAERDKYKMMLTDLQGEIDTDDADEMSAAAKALLTKALANVTTAAPEAVMVKVADGELKPEVADYTLGAMPDMIEGWMGATLMDKDGNTIVVYSDRGALGGTMFLDAYTGMIVDGTRTYDIGTEADEVMWADVKRTDTSAGPGLKPGSTMFAGSVMGVPGTFSCVATSGGLCTAPPRYTDGAVDATSSCST